MRDIPIVLTPFEKHYIAVYQFYGIENELDYLLNIASNLGTKSDNLQGQIAVSIFV